MATPRRDFLGWLGGSALYAGAGIPLGGYPPTLTGRTPISAEFDMSWTDRVKGSHRAIFDSPQVNEGGALYRAETWVKQYKEVYGTDPSEMTAVLVLRHEGIVLAMDDAYWAEFEVGKATKMKDPRTRKWVTGNPVAATAPGTPAEFADINLATFQQRGGILLACNLAFGGLVDEYKKKHGGSDEEARKLAISHLVPGVILQPSGFFAALRAQEAGCHYFMAS